MTLPIDCSMSIEGLPREYILVCAFYPDRFADRDMPPDRFFMHMWVEEAVWEHNYWLRFADAVEALLIAVHEKYEQFFRIEPFNPLDLFWSVEGKPTEPQYIYGPDDDRMDEPEES